MVLAVSSALGYCCLNVGVRFALADITVWGILLTRGLVGVCAVTLAARLLKKNIFGKNMGLLALIGLTGFVSTACTTTAISRIPLYQAMVLLYLYPALTVPMGYFINGVRVRRRDCLLVILAFVGCLFLIWPDSTEGFVPDIGHVAGLAGSVLYSLAFVLISRLGEDNCGLEPLFAYSFWSFVGAGAVLVFGLVDFGLVSPGAVGAALGLGVIAQVSILMGYAALRWLAPFKVGVIGTLEVFGGAFSSWLIFNDPMTVRALIGSLIILFVALQLRRA